MKNTEMITSSKAGEILHCSPTMARNILGGPDGIYIMDNRKKQFLYDPVRVRMTAEKYHVKLERKKQEYGLRSCRSCCRKFRPEELTTGKCPLCRADTWFWNFVCHGDCFKKSPDPAMLDILKSALDRTILKMKEKGI